MALEANHRKSGVILVPRDKRRHPRVRFSGPVLLDSQQKWTRALGRDVSAGGLSVDSDEQFDIGTELDVYFELPGGVAIETRGRVVRSNGPRLSVAFDAEETAVDSAPDEPFSDVHIVTEGQRRRAL